MPLNLNIKSVTLLFFVIHFLIFFGILLYRGIITGKKSSLWLSAYLFFCILYIFPFMVGYGGWYAFDNTRALLFSVPFQQLFLLAPLLYFYFKTLLNEELVFKKKELVHLVPALLYNIYVAFMFAADRWSQDTFQFYQDGRDRDFDLWYQISGFIMLCGYALSGLRSYFGYVKAINDSLSYADELTYKWARNFLIVFVTIIALRLAFFITNPEWGNFGDKFWYYFAFGLVTIYLSFNGYAHAVLGNAFAKAKLTGTVKAMNSDRDQSISDEEIEVLKERVTSILISKELYKKPTLTVGDLAFETGVSQKRLSQIINSGLKMNFNDFINLHRINEVASRIDQGDLEKYTLLGLAEEAGFNSKTTFNRVFKKVFMSSPKEYAKDSEKRGAKSGFGAIQLGNNTIFEEKK